MGNFANDASAYLANILCSLTSDLDFMVFNSAQFFSTLSGKMIQESEITESFDLELLFTNILAAWQKLENDPSLSICMTKTRSVIADLLNFEWRSTYFQDK